jgi:23S rRNA (cytidine1920-2'-O)/16S rRNA (cytidine1409-2'-O)-methyltransferase
MMARIRLDQLVVERGLAPSRERARALILSGQVTVDDRAETKAGTSVDSEATIALLAPDHPYAGRGGLKLAHALDTFHIDVKGRECLDIGASTGGFTDVLLQRGAARVIALDVGYGQLHPRLRDDPRVTVLERLNARELTELPFPPQLVTCDVSFISVRKALPPALRLAAHGWEAVVLVKPQFEAGRADVGKGGVVTSRETRTRVAREVAETALEWDAEVVGAVDSGLPGPKGNRELFLHLVHRPGGARLHSELDSWIDDAVV